MNVCTKGMCLLSQLRAFYLLAWFGASVLQMHRLFWLEGLSKVAFGYHGLQDTASSQDTHPRDSKRLWTQSLR